jgi:hypothetical protein
MARQDTPYVYGDERPDGGLRTGDPNDDGTVIVDGAVMSYRSYRRLGD